MIWPSDSSGNLNLKEQLSLVSLTFRYGRADFHIEPKKGWKYVTIVSNLTSSAVYFLEKVRIFWEGHKILQNLQLTFVSITTSKVEFSQNFVTFSEYMNFTSWRKFLLLAHEWRPCDIAYIQNLREQQHHSPLLYLSFEQPELMRWLSISHLCTLPDMTCILAGHLLHLQNFVWLKPLNTLHEWNDNKLSMQCIERVCKFFQF